MAEYIDRENTVSRIKKFYENRYKPFFSVDDVIKLFNAIPTVDVVEVEHGYWKWEETMSLVDPAPIILCCSVCNGCHDVSEDFKYCPHCGAKMDLKERK